MKLKLNQKIEVKWDDAVRYSSWLLHSDAIIKNQEKCSSIGYFLNQDKEVLRLSCTIGDEDESPRDLIIIPQGCITHIRKIK